MCIICVEMEKDRLSWNEALRNLGEMREDMTDQHYVEVQMKIAAAEREEEENEVDNSRRPSLQTQQPE